MADERERHDVDRLRVDRDEEDATGPDVEAHQAEAERLMRDREDDADADEGRERRR